MALLLVLLFQQAFAFALAAPPEPGPSSSASWSNFRAAVNQQSLQTVLISIEERLRALDTLYSPRYTPRWEVSIEQQSRRMETIESRLGRLETLLELRLDKLSETMSARQLKEELAKDQINRKIDSTYERLNHRLGYLEARLDVGIAKLQSTVDAGVGRMERLESTAVGRQGEVETELNDIGTGIDEIKKRLSVFEERYNNSLLTIVENGRHMAIEMNNMTTRMEDLHFEFNKTQNGNEQNDDEGINTQKNINIMVEKITNGLDRHANNFITKANNMYNDMWRRMQQLEGLAKDTMSLSNATRRELQEGIRTIAMQMGRRGLFQSDRERQEGSMDLALDALGLIQRRLNELGRKFDSSFQMLMLAQNLFLESCHRIQLDEPQMEAKLTRVLERILDTITNSSVTVDHEVREMMDLLKSHSAHMTRSIGHTTTMVVQSSEKSSQLQLELLSAKEQLLEGNKYIEDAISDIREEKLAASDKLDNITTTLQEVQNSVAELARATHEADKLRISTGCPDSEQIAFEILEEMQRKQLKSLVNNSGFDDLSENEEGFEEMISGNDIDGNFQEEGNIPQTKVNASSAESVPKANISSMEKVPAFQLPHRFDVQTNRGEDPNELPQVTIEIVADDSNFNSNKTDDLDHVVRDSEDSLLGFDLHNVAAIIQDSDSHTDAEKQKPILTIVHTILRKGENDTNIQHFNDTDLKINPNGELNATIKPTNINKTYTSVQTTEPPSDQDSVNSTSYIPVTFPSENKMTNVVSTNITESTSNNNQNLSISESKQTNSTVSQKKISEDKNASTFDENMNIQMPLLLKKITELHTNDQKHNTTVTNFWRFFISKLQNQNMTLINDNFNLSQGNNLAANPFSINSDTLQSLNLALNDTKNNQHQQYLERLQELASELVKPTNITNEESEQMLDR